MTSPLPQPKIPTPDYYIIPRELRQLLYEPDSDTHFLLDFIEGNLNVLQRIAQFECVSALEFGAGSGTVSAFMRTAAKTVGLKVLSFATDISPHAATATTLMCPEGDVIRCSLGSAFRAAPLGGFDIILFNAPYVPSDAAELAADATDDPLARTYAGGEDGAEVLVDAIATLPALLRRGPLRAAAVQVSVDGAAVARGCAAGASSELAADAPPPAPAVTAAQVGLDDTTTKTPRVVSTTPAVVTDAVPHVVDGSDDGLPAWAPRNGGVALFLGMRINNAKGQLTRAAEANGLTLSVAGERYACGEWLVIWALRHA